MADRYWVNNGGNWSDKTNHWSASSGGSPGATKPTVSDVVYFDDSSFSIADQIVTMDDTDNLCLDFDTTDVTNTPSFIFPDNTKKLIVGRSIITLAGTIFGDGNGYVGLGGGLSNNGTVNTGGVKIDVNIVEVYSTVSRTLTMNSNLECKRLYFNSGIFNANNFDILCKTIHLGAAGTDQTTINMGNGNYWTISPRANVAFSMTNHQIINPGTSTIIIACESGAFPTSMWLVGNISFYNLILNGDDFNNLVFQFDGISGASNLTMNSFKLIYPPFTIIFDSASTYAATNLTLVGSTGKLITLKTETNGQKTTLSATRLAIQYVDVKDNIAAGTIPFYDYPGGVDSGNNENWLFPTAPVTSEDQFLLMF